MFQEWGTDTPGNSFVGCACVNIKASDDMAKMKADWKSVAGG